MENTSNQETAPKLKHRVFYSNVSRDPYDFDNVFCHAAITLGYPIQFQDGATSKSGKNLEWMMRAMVDSQETKEKLHVVAIELGALGEENDSVSYTLEAMDLSAISLIRPLLEKEDSLHSLPVKYKMPIDAEDLKKIYMRGYFRALENAEKAANPPAPISPEEKMLFQKLYEEGVKPLDFKEARSLLIPAIQNLLEIHPDSKAENYSSSI